MPEPNRDRGCRWPMWPNSARPTHEYCGEKKIPGQSYCEEHRAMSVRNYEREPRQVFVPRKFAA